MGHVPEYLERHRSTGRSVWADELAVRYPVEADPATWWRGPSVAKQLIGDLMRGRRR
jgi:hypothetical protein